MEWLLLVTEACACLGYSTHRWIESPVYELKTSHSIWVGVRTLNVASFRGHRGQRRASIDESEFGEILILFEGNEVTGAELQP